VLCAIDFSESSRRALRHAALVATRARGRLVVLYVNDPLLVAAAGATRPRFDLGAQSAQELESFLRATPGTSAPSHVESRVATGEPADQILSCARTVAADLIVVGSHGLTGIARLAFGSTTTAILKRSSVPVLVVPAGNRTARRPPPSWPSGRVVAPVMLDRGTARDIDAASRVAAWFGCSLLVVHALATPPVPAWLRRPLAGQNMHRIERMRQRLAGLVASTARVRVLEGSPADVIAAVVTRERTPLLITMLREGDRWLEPGRGAVTYRILTRVNVPVLAMPPRWRGR
jgi:nucleotide-binding universal stress UspA family protein